MSSLRPSEKSKFEDLFNMSSGYVLNFGDGTFGKFISELTDLDIHSEKYTKNGTSKARKFRVFWNEESDAVVGRVLLELLEYWRQSSDSDPKKNELYDQCRGIANRLLATGPRLNDLKAKAFTLDAFHLTEQIRRLEESIQSDPALAIGTSKELIETVCKTILVERGVSLPGAPDMPTLTKETFKQLKLVPEGIPEEAKGAKTIKVMLSNLNTISQGLAELRGLYGTGHGNDGKVRGLSPRHAKLAVGAATTLATFLFETHSETKS